MGDFFVGRGFREDFGVVPASAPESGMGVDPGLRSGSEAEAFLESFFLGVVFSVVDCWERRTLFEGGLAGLDSSSTVDARRFFSGVEGEGGSGGGVCKP